MRADDTPCKKKKFSFRCGLAGSVHQETMDSSVPSIYEHYIVVIFCSEWTIRDWSTMFVARGIPNTNVYGTRPFEGMTCEKICVVDEFNSVVFSRINPQWFQNHRACALFRSICVVISTSILPGSQVIWQSKMNLFPVTVRAPEIISCGNKIPGALRVRVTYSMLAHWRPPRGGRAVFVASVCGMGCGEEEAWHVARGGSL